MFPVFIEMVQIAGKQHRATFVQFQVQGLVARRMAGHGLYHYGAIPKNIEITVQFFYLLQFFYRIIAVCVRLLSLFTGDIIV